MKGAIYFSWRGLNSSMKVTYKNRECISLSIQNIYLYDTAYTAGLYTQLNPPYEIGSAKSEI